MAACNADVGMLYHLVPAAAWRAAKEANDAKAYFPPSYAQDGFTHLTKDPSLLLSVANHFYKSVPGEHLVIQLDGAKLKGEVKFEPAAPVGATPALPGKKSGGGGGGGDDPNSEVLFPHLYGGIDLGAATRELRVGRREADGEFLSIEGI